MLNCTVGAFQVLDTPMLISGCAQGAQIFKLVKKKIRRSFGLVRPLFFDVDREAGLVGSGEIFGNHQNKVAGIPPLLLKVEVCIAKYFDDLCFKTWFCSLQIPVNPAAIG